MAHAAKEAAASLAVARVAAKRAYRRRATTGPSLVCAGENPRQRPTAPVLEAPPAPPSGRSKGQQLPRLARRLSTWSEVPLAGVRAAGGRQDEATGQPVLPAVSQPVGLGVVLGRGTPRSRVETPNSSAATSVVVRPTAATAARQAARTVRKRVVKPPPPKAGPGVLAQRAWLTVRRALRRRGRRAKPPARTPAAAGAPVLARPAQALLGNVRLQRVGLCSYRRNLLVVIAAGA